LERIVLFPALVEQVNANPLLKTMQISPARTDRVVESNNVSTLMVVTIVIDITTNISSSAALVEMVISITISTKSWPIPCLTVKDRVNAIVCMYLVIFVCL